MAKEIKNFEDFLEAFKSRIPQGMVIDTQKMEDLKKIYENKGKISKIEDFCVKAEDVKQKQEQNKEQQNKENESSKKEKATVINEVAPERSEENTNAPAPAQNEDSNWKSEIEKEWRFWGSDNGLIYEDSSLPNEPETLSLRFYKSEKDKKERNFDAEISYNGPNNLTLTSPKGQTPDEKYFQKAVELAMKNGTAIEFGDIKSPEFKAKLFAACIKNGAEVVNMPTAEEMAKWPDELKKMVEDAKTQAAQTANNQEGNTANAQGANTNNNQENTAANTQEANTENKKEEQTQQNSSAKSKIAELRARIQNRNANLEEAREAAMITGGELLKEDVKAIEQEGMTAEEIKLRELRGQAKEGNKQAGHELDKRRYNTMTDEFKYEREVEVDEKGQAKTDDKGKPVYKKDKDGNFVYKQNDKGQKIKTAAYEAFLKRAGNNLSK